MTLDTHTIHGTDSTDDGTDWQVWSPGAGELWYVDSVIMYCDGTGNTGNYEEGVHYQVGQADTPLKHSTERLFVGGGDVESEKSGVLGMYVSDDEEIVVRRYVQDSTKTGANMTYTVHLRRLL